MQKMMFNDRYGLTQAVVEGRKMMTRRIIDPAPKGELRGGMQDPDGTVRAFFDLNADVKARYKIGEIVAVAQSYDQINPQIVYFTADETGEYIGTHKGQNNKMFVKAVEMPHQIRITDIRCERLQDISEENCMKEGVYIDGGDDAYMPHYFYDYPNNQSDGFDTPRQAFASLIDKVCGRGTWAKNPYVWVYEFELVK